MTLTDTDVEPPAYSLVTRDDRRWFREGQVWREQLPDHDEGPAVTWPELVSDGYVDLVIVGSTGLPPVAGLRAVDRRRTMGRGTHP